MEHQYKLCELCSGSNLGMCAPTEWQLVRDVHMHFQAHKNKAAQTKSPLSHVGICFYSCFNKCASKWSGHPIRVCCCSIVLNSTQWVWSACRLQPPHTHKHKCIRAHTYTHTLTQTHAHTRTQTHTHANTHTHTHTHTHARTHTHTHTYTCARTLHQCAALR